VKVLVVVVWVVMCLVLDVVTNVFEECITSSFRVEFPEKCSVTATQLDSPEHN
jgi:hypothetical protein